MAAELERKTYPPDRTPEEVEALKQRAKVHGPGIVSFKAEPVLSLFSLDLCITLVAELARAHGYSKLLLDATETARPSAEIGELVRRRLKEHEDVIQHIAVVTGENFLINIAAKFVLAGIPQECSVHKTLEQAEEALAHADR